MCHCSRTKKKVYDTAKNGTGVAASELQKFANFKLHPNDNKKEIKTRKKQVGPAIRHNVAGKISFTKYLKLLHKGKLVVMLRLLKNGTIETVFGFRNSLLIIFSIDTITEVYAFQFVVSVTVKSWQTLRLKLGAST